MGSHPCTQPPSLSMAAKEIWKAVAMADHFEKIQKLPDPVPGCPNFRRVPGYKVYCCGQPTVAGFRAALEKVCGTIYPKDGKIIWVNMRQEPNVYINGEPVCARPPNKIGEYAELGDVNRDKVKEDELEFAKVLENRAADAEGKVKVVDINKVEKEVEMKELITLSNVIESLKEDFPGLHHMRIPVCNSASPTEVDFDILVQTLVGTTINCPVIISDQVGLSRATTGCVAACVFKEFQISASFEGLIETVPGMNLDLLKMDRYKVDMKKDALFRGEFEVIKELCSIIPDGDAAKRECDKVIDKNGPPKTGGTGIKQLRENIAESTLSLGERSLSRQINSKCQRLLSPGWRITSSCVALLRRVRASSSGRGTPPPQPWPTSSLSPPPTSRQTWAGSSMTSIRRHTQCSRTCHRATTRNAPSTGLHQRL